MYPETMSLILCYNLAIMGRGAKFLIIFIIVGVSIAILASLSPKNNTSTTDKRVENKDLAGKANFSDGQFHITNQENEDWKDCYFTINSKYRYPTDPMTTRVKLLKSRETLSIGAGEFTLSDGTRFNFLSTKPKDLSASCCDRFGYRSW